MLEARCPVASVASAKQAHHASSVLTTPPFFATIDNTGTLPGCNEVHAAISDAQPPPAAQPATTI